MMDKRYIVVEGPIGVGKTSMVQMLGEEFGSRVILEKEKPEVNEDMGVLQRGLEMVKKG